MTDKEFLQWVHDRLQYQHDENPNYDYMHKLRAIIKACDDEKFTPNVVSGNRTRSAKDELLDTIH